MANEVRPFGSNSCNNNVTCCKGSNLPVAITDCTECISAGCTFYGSGECSVNCMVPSDGPYGCLLPPRCGTFEVRCDQNMRSILPDCVLGSCMTCTPRMQAAGVNCIAPRPPSPGPQPPAPPAPPAPPPPSQTCAAYMETVENVKRCNAASGSRKTATDCATCLDTKLVQPTLSPPRGGVRFNDVPLLLPLHAKAPTCDCGYYPAGTGCSRSGGGCGCAGKYYCAVDGRCKKVPGGKCPAPLPPAPPSPLPQNNTCKWQSSRGATGTGVCIYRCGMMGCGDDVCPT